MSSIVPFLQEKVFDQSAIEVMSKALDLSIKRMRGQKQPHLVLEVIADRIVAVAANGERDIHRLCEKALEGLPADFSLIAER